jgi:S-formylglutathione hydrolase FrmB
MHLTTSSRRHIVGALAAALVLPLAVSAGTASAAPTPTTPTPTPTTTAATTTTATPTTTPTTTSSSAKPAAVTPAALITSTATLNHIEAPVLGQFDVFINSPAMGRVIKAHVLAPPGYDRGLNAAATYPTYYLLDGLRAPTTSSDWVNQGGAVPFFRDKNALVVMSVGGGGSFFQNWAATDPGLLAANHDPANSSLNWETFLTHELPSIIETTTLGPFGPTIGGNGSRAVGGLSMGGFSAFDFAAKHPGLYRAAASFSGFPDTQTYGIPQFLYYVLSQEIGVTNPDDMWGRPDGALWPANNPTTLIQSLKNQGISLYMSAGTGLNGAFDAPLGFGGLSAEFVGAILEVVANYSSQSFNISAVNRGLPVTLDLLNPGIHSWPYWNIQMKQSWPQIAAAIGA